jgi:hypothetical protein
MAAQAGAWIDERFGGEQSESADDSWGARPRAAAPRAIVVEPLAAGATASTSRPDLEVKPLETASS